MKISHRVGILIINLGRHSNCKYCSAVHLILNQKDSRLGRVRYIIYSTNETDLRMSHEEVSCPLTLRQEIQNIHIFNRLYQC